MGRKREKYTHVKTSNIPIVKSMREEGKTYNQIGEALGLTYEEVKYMVIRYIDTKRECTKWDREAKKDIIKSHFVDKVIYKDIAIKYNRKAATLATLVALMKRTGEYGILMSEIMKESVKI